MSDDQIIEAAQRWARLYLNPKLRSRMDKVLEEGDEDDRRRIVLCGQRISGGLSIKLVPAATTKEEPSEPKRRRKAATKRSTEAAS